MPVIEDYIARIEGACGAEKDVIVNFKYEKKDEAIKHIMQRSEIKNNLSGIIFELQYKDVKFRVYPSGKAIFHSIKNREELNKLLAALLL